MLVLTRKPGERIVIVVGGVEIIVTVARLKAGAVSLGFVAPRDVVILREEIAEKRQSTTG